jgi:rod shape-determining protein MreC
MRKKNFFVLYLLAVAVSVTFALSPARGFLASSLRKITSGPAATFSKIGRGAADFLGSFGKISSLKKDNADLAQKISSLEVDRSKISELEQENKLLQKELGFMEQNQTFELVPARIIGREPTSFLDYLVIDRGESDGLKKDMAAVSGGVLIGQIGDVFDHQSKVVLVTSKDSIIQAMLQNSRARGVLKGGISGLVLENISQDTEVSPGEYIVTSGLGGEIKEGMLIGKANGIQSAGSSLFKNIPVEPLADLSRLEMVFIIRSN